MQIDATVAFHRDLLGLGLKTTHFAPIEEVVSTDYQVDAAAAVAYPVFGGAVGAQLVRRPLGAQRQMFGGAPKFSKQPSGAEKVFAWYLLLIVLFVTSAMFAYQAAQVAPIERGIWPTVSKLGMGASVILLVVSEFVRRRSS